MKAVLYERFSPRPDTAECESLETQHERNLAYCRMAELDPADLIQEPDTSAGLSLLERPEGRRLLALAQKHKHVVVQRLDRLFRNAGECLVQVDVWNKQGVTLHLADQGGCSIKTSTAIGLMFIGQLALFADFERRIIKERTQDGMRSNQRRGRRQSKIPPYGKMLDPADPRRLIDYPEEQANITIILALEDSGYGLREIARHLEKAGITCRGNGWNHGLIKKILHRAESDAAS